MKRTLKFTLEIDLDELPKAERKDCAELEGCKMSELPTVEDIDPGCLAEHVESAIEHNEEFWAGSGMYAKVVSARAVPADHT